MTEENRILKTLEKQFDELVSEAEKDFYEYDPSETDENFEEVLINDIIEIVNTKYPKDIFDVDVSFDYITDYLDEGTADIAYSFSSILNRVFNKKLIDYLCGYTDNMCYTIIVTEKQ